MHLTRSGRIILAEFFFGWLDPICPFFFTGHWQKEWPDQVRPMKKNSAVMPLLVYLLELDVRLSFNGVVIVIL